MFLCVISIIANFVVSSEFWFCIFTSNRSMLIFYLCDLEIGDKLLKTVIFILLISGQRRFTRNTWTVGLDR